MKCRIAILALCFNMFITSVWAGPTSLFWTNCTTQVQPTGTGQLQVYNYFTVCNRRGHGQYFNPDIGFLIGAYSWEDLQLEVGVDYFGGADDPLFFNGKVAIEEGKLFCHSPSFSAGIFNIGTRAKHHRTNQNIVDFVFGKSLPEWFGGTFYIGGFGGTKAMGRIQQGIMIGYLRNFCHTKDCNGKEYDKWSFCADWASGKNTIGGGGAALCYYFTPDIYLETGPVFFNTAKYNGTWKWSVQLYATFPLFDSKA